ncbi:MAG: hypothetical protein K0S18_1271 [Anaerocolumna sp.]|jgi:HSP20 family molecular chaperone IbpA|nr:hypothetical protein [Anaerocolumna sp.]
MKGERDKILKIMNELVCFFFTLGISDPHIDIKKTETSTTILVEAAYKDPDHKKIDRFQELIQNGRQEDLEEYYWNLAGNSQYPEFILLGTLIDSANISYENQILRIEVTRKHN